MLDTVTLDIGMSLPLSLECFARAGASTLNFSSYRSRFNFVGVEYICSNSPTPICMVGFVNYKALRLTVETEGTSTNASGRNSAVHQIGSVVRT